MAGTYDIFSGRRTTFDTCYWWVQVEGIKDKSKLVVETKPKGKFKARKITPKDISRINLDNAFLFKRNTVTIVTNDFFDIKEYDVVKFDDVIWRVDNVQIVEEERQEQFRKRISSTLYLRLVK